MFTFLLWVAIIGCLLLAARRIARGAAVTLVFIAMLFFAVFMLDSVTTFPIREYITLGWYDETIKDPVGTVQSVGGGALEKGAQVADAITETGKRLDVKYGSEESKEWILVGEVESEEENKPTEIEEDNKEIIKGKEKKRYVVDQNVGKDKNKVKDEKKEELKRESFYVTYKEVNTALNNELKSLAEQDKEIIRGMTSIYKTKIVGLGMEVWNNDDDGDKGMYVKIISYN